MLYIGYKDPLPSQLDGMMRGAKIELDNKAVKAFTYLDDSEEDPKDLKFSEIFPRLDAFLEPSHKNPMPVNLARYLVLKKKNY